MLSDKKGIALLIVMGLVLMFSILGGAALMMMSTGHFSTSFRQIKRTRAYYAAEAGMQHALWALRTGQVTPLPYSGNLQSFYKNNELCHYLAFLLLRLKMRGDEPLPLPNGNPLS